MGAGHSAEGDCGAYASDPSTHDRRKTNKRRRRHSVDSVASYSSQNHVDRIRTQNFSAASCQEDVDFGSIKTSLFRRSTSNLDYPIKRPDSVTSNTSSTRSRLRELVERKSSSEEHKPAANTVADIQYFENPAETLEFDNPRNSLDSRNSQEERPKKKKQSKNKEKNKDYCEIKNKKHEKYQSKLAEYYKLPIQLPQDEFYQHLTRSRAAEELLQKRFSNSDTEFNGSYGRLCKHKENEGSTNLRRSRSLAVIREETFTDLQIQNHAKNKRSQLIPRARLFDKPCFRDRLPGRAKYQTKEEVLEAIYIDSTASCFGDINRSKVDDIPDDKVQNGSGKEDDVSQNESRQSQSIGGSWPNLIEESKQTNLSEDSIGHSRNPSEIDSLDSNYVRKHYNFEEHLKNYKENSDTEHSFNSGNINNKELYIANNDHNGEIEEEAISKNKSPFHSEENISITRSDQPKCVHDSILIPEKDDSYDEISIRSNKSPIQEIYDTAIVNSTKTSEDKDIDLQSVISENDGTISSPPDSITSYISISIASSTDKSQKLEHLANSLAEKIDEYCDTHFNENNSVISNNINTDYHKNSNTDPIYTKVQKKTFADIRKDSLKKREDKSPSNEIYVNNTYIENKNKKNNCTSTRNITTEPFVTTLIENQYYSLPDINISKCLRKSERIDAQLREEDKEDIPCENTYEIAHTNFKEILAAKSSEQYGHLNRSYNQSPQLATNTTVYVPEYKEANILNSFTKLDDDLESIVTIESSNVDDQNYYNSGVHHQNEREINEIEGTIRNNKIITKAESLKLSSSIIRPDIKISKSLSNDNINKSVLEKNKKTNIRKHYSLRQRDPSNDNIRIPSPDTVEKTLHSCIETENLKPKIPEGVKSNSLLSRVQSFKTSSESSITILPLSGHQTIVIDPPITKSVTDLCHTNTTVHTPDILQKESKEEKVEETNHNSLGSIETSNFYIPKDPFITIKLNKVVKKTIPKLTKEIPNQTFIEQVKIDKPPSKLIIKDSNNSTITSTYTKATDKMTRPQVIRVVDSKNKIASSNNSTESSNCEISKTSNKVDSNEKPEKKDDHFENKNDNKNEFTVKEKLHNAIKTDLEYQEKINSVKSYWSKLIEKPTEDHLKQEVTENEKSAPNNNITTKVEITETKNDDTKYVPEISVGSIIKSLESVKIVDSIKKISQTTKKLQLWKEETEKVKSDSEIEEPTVQKIKKESEGTIYDRPKPTKITKEGNQDMSRDTPEIEIVELSSEDNQNQKTQATIIKAKGYEKGCDEFDHVRYKVMKSELFKNSMIANYRKEAQFDGLLQYLQDYSFQELLVNNNIVIIEPVRTKVEPTPKKNNNLDPCKIPSSLLKKNDNNSGQIDKSKNAIKRHFFYHPIRVNKEIIEEELPNPDTVKKVRNLFEDTLKMRSPVSQDPPLVNENSRLTRRATSYRNISEENKTSKIGGRKKVIRQLTIDTNIGNKKWDNASLSSGVSSGDLSSNNEFDQDGPYSKNLKDNVYSSSDEYLYDSMSQDFCCESQYVSPEILKKIRDCGTSITYYGGKVLNSKTGSSVSPMTKVIMDEIKSLQKNCSRDCYSCQTKCKGDKCSCLVADRHAQMVADKQNLNISEERLNQESYDRIKRSDGFPGFKFKLVKSNSCSSRLELTGTDESQNPRLKYRKQRSTEDPPLVHDEDNSVKNKICRLESYNKGIVKTPFENNNNENKKLNLNVRPQVNKVSEEKEEISIHSSNNNEHLKKDKEREGEDSYNNLVQCDNQNINDAHTFEKKFYYLNENLDSKNVPTGKFGEMVFEEFEVLESCYDSLNSNKSLK
ncbi:protein javelin [Papilio machaon]|uniref:protein javelin n=1 Tax=Papilio machaon TaxID=76193 RepID=UPI001E663D89|nr:protein javelin [Papilio machaon]